jgi:exodeoxyribonuclease-3
MKIFSWNVNGIRAVIKKGVFQPFLEQFRPDIVCLQETKAERGQFEIDLPDYREYWNSAVKKGYSGTAIFSKQEPLSSTAFRSSLQSASRSPTNCSATAPRKAGS